MATPSPLILDLVDWLADGPRPYADVMDAWRSSCPRLTIWEDAVDAGLVSRLSEDGVASVALTSKGRRLARRQPKGGGDG